MIQISQNGVSISDDEKIKDLRESFARNHCVVLPQLFEPSLLQRIIKQIDSAKFYPNKHLDYKQQEFATDLSIGQSELALHQINLLLNNRKLFHAIEAITGCGEIGSFGGRIYRNQPNTDNQLEWHDDMESKERLIGISINLSEKCYEGGAFQLREKQSKNILCEVGCRGMGDAHLFRISTELEHRVIKVSGDNPRTAAAGWFVSYPDIATTIKSLFALQNSNLK